MPVPFGFSVGDFIAGATLAYKLVNALSSSSQSAKQYRDLITQLNIIHKVLLQVEQIRAANQFSQSTVNALLFATNSANEQMINFLKENEKYMESLKAGGSGNVVKDGLRKMKWSQLKLEEVKTLRETLSMMLMSVNCLVTTAYYLNSQYSPGYTLSLDVPGAHQQRVSGLAGRLDRPDSRQKRASGMKDVKIASRLTPKDVMDVDNDPNYAKQPNPRRFFRPGQVFSVLICSQMNYAAWSTSHPNPWSVKLEDIQTLQAGKKAEDQKKIEDQKNAEALRKTADQDNVEDPKKIDTQKEPLRARKLAQTGPPTPQFTPSNSNYIGPTLICRFVAVREAYQSSLCLNIRTYAGQGCVGRNDQARHAIMYCGKDAPPILDGEEEMVLPPIRVEADHPSTALPSPSRIHFGLACEVDHNVQVRPLGLVDVETMPSLISNFEAYCVESADSLSCYEFDDGDDTWEDVSSEEEQPEMTKGEKEAVHPIPLESAVNIKSYVNEFQNLGRKNEDLKVEKKQAQDTPPKGNAPPRSPIEPALKSGRSVTYSDEELVELLKKI